MGCYNGALITDIDGTVVRGCLEHKLSLSLMKHGLVRRERFENVLRLERERRHRKIPHRVLNDAWVRAINADGLEGVSREDMTRVSRELIERDGQQVYVFMRELIASCKAHGYLLAAISGSSEDVVGPFCGQFGFDVVVGSKYPHRDGVHVAGPGEFCAEKKDVVTRNTLEEYALGESENVIAVGDTAADFTMLQVARYGIAFNPNGELIDLMVEHGPRRRPSGVMIVRESKDAITLSRQYIGTGSVYEESARLPDALPAEICYDMRKRLGSLLKYHS